MTVLNSEIRAAQFAKTTNNSRSTQPTCNVAFRIIYGTQPENGTMDVSRKPPPVVPDFKKAGVFVITYNFPNGIQTVCLNPFKV